MGKTQERKIIILGDLHLSEDSITEIDSIIDEIDDIALNNDITEFFQLGDLCDRKVLTAKELYCLARTIRIWKNRFDYTSIIEGNHDKISQDMSILKFLYFQDINLYSDTHEFNNIILGHWFTDKSRDAFNNYKWKVEDLLKKNFSFCLLGHQHTYQSIGNGIYHLGSGRFVSFAEDEKMPKKCAILTLNETGNEIEFIDLKSPIQMYNISNIKDLEQIPQKSKVRYIFKSFTQLKNEIEIINKFKDKFYSFKKKLDFNIEPIKLEEPKEKRNTKDIIKNWLSKIQDKDIQNILEKEFTMEFK